MSPPASPAFSFGSAAKVMPRMAGNISAAPTPIAPRAAISQYSFCAAPPSRDMTMKIVVPMKNSRRRPNRSAPAARHDQHPEDERVGVDHPLDGGDRAVEGLLDRGQRNVQRGEVLGEDEDAEPHRDQREHGAAIHRRRTARSVTSRASAANTAL